MTAHYNRRNIPQSEHESAIYPTFDTEETEALFQRISPALRRWMYDNDAYVSIKLIQANASTAPFTHITAQPHNLYKVTFKTNITGQQMTVRHAAPPPPKLIDLLDVLLNSIPATRPPATLEAWAACHRNGPISLLNIRSLAKPWHKADIKAYHQADKIFEEGWRDTLLRLQNLYYASGTHEHP
jgi:hypothetical protein